MHYLDPSVLLGLRGKAKVKAKLKLVFVVLLLVFPSPLAHFSYAS